MPPRGRHAAPRSTESPDADSATAAGPAIHLPGVYRLDGAPGGRLAGLDQFGLPRGRPLAPSRFVEPAGYDPPFGYVEFDRPARPVSPAASDPLSAPDATPTRGARSRGHAIPRQGLRAAIVGRRGRPDR